MNDLKTGITDVHVHIFPPRMFEAVWKYFESHDWAVHHEQVDAVAKTLAAHGVATAVALSYPHKTGVAESLNLYMEQVGRDYPIFRPFASVHPEDGNLRSYIDRAIDSEYIYGFKFQPLVQMFDVNHPKLDYLYARCEERGIPITMHIGTGPLDNPYVGPAHFRKLIKRFPLLRACVPHMGAPEYDDFLELMGDHPNMFLDTTMINTPTDLFDTAFHGNRELLLKYADRICYGSDWPNVPYSYQDALDSVTVFEFGQGHDAVIKTNGLKYLQINRTLSGDT